VPPLQRTEGQPPPIAAHGGCPTCPFDREGDAGTAAALEDALAEIGRGRGPALTDTIAKGTTGPIKTKWASGSRLRRVFEVHPRVDSIKAPAAAWHCPLPYTSTAADLLRRPVQRSWRDRRAGRHSGDPAQNEKGNRRRDLYFPQVLRDARRIGEYYPGLSPNSPECMDRLGVSLAQPRVQVHEYLRCGGSGARYYPEIEKLLLEFFRMRPMALVYNHDVFDKDYTGDRTEDQDGNNRV